MYDSNNIFAKIISKKVESNLVYEDKILLIIHDINPIAPIHLLAIPKNPYTDFDDFVYRAHKEEVYHYFNIISRYVRSGSILDQSYRLIMNKGEACGQTVFHFHTHIISGKEMRKLT